MAFYLGFGIVGKIFYAMAEKTTEEYFDSIIASALEAGVKKMEQYGTSWTSYRKKSLLKRMFNKGKRIVVIQETGKNLVGETIKGEFKEILTYAGLFGMMVEQNIPMHAELPPEQVTKYREQVFEKAKAIMQKKNHDYGEAWRGMDQDEIVDEIDVKIRRMLSMVKNKMPVDIDNVYDIINYCAFALILIEEGVHTDM